MTITNIKSFIGIILITGLTACGASTVETEADSEATKTSEKADDPRPHATIIKSNDEKSEGSQQMILTGQILYQQIEGGFYGFVANNGDKYTPSGLKNEYRKNGLIVELKVELIPDIMTTTQFGESVKVLEIKILDSSKVSDTHKSM